jgi:thiamine-phosphate pyrophosphorylase
LRELRRAEAGGAALLFLSPVFQTRSHPGAATLGPRRFAQLAGNGAAAGNCVGRRIAGERAQAVAARCLWMGGIDAWTK